MSSDEAPSLICEALPAVMAPSSRNAGLIFAIDSIVPPRRTPSRR